MPKPPAPLKLRVSDYDLENLRSSGLTDETIYANRLRTVTKSLVFPYRDLDGETNGFARVRPHSPRIIDGKPVKYEQPKGSCLRAYFPAASLPKLRDGVEPVYITEGEKKALAISQLGKAAIGLGGVWCGCVKTKKSGTYELIDDLKAIAWDGREVFIVFDYDEKPDTRQQVTQARQRLTKLLKAAGAAQVYTVTLPPAPDGKKQGVDDYLVANGTRRFAELVDRAKDDGDGGALVTQRLSDIEPEEVEWLWEKRFAAGKLNIVHGDPGVGKTWVVLDTLGHVTTGTPFCDGSPCKKGEVLFVTAEDGHADTIRPRMDLLGADVDRVHVLKLVRFEGREVALDLERHLGILDAWLDRHPKVRVVAMDPLAAFLGKINSHQNNEVRAVLGQLAKLAENRKAAILAIDHLAKAPGKALHRGIGSIAFTAAPRAVWQVLADPDDPERRLFLPVKMNLAKVAGLEFRINDDGLAWAEGPVTISADDVAAESGETPRAEAKEWLRGVLKNGPYPAKDVERLAAQDGICMRTLKYAKKEMGVESRRCNGMWAWAYPQKAKPRG